MDKYYVQIKEQIVNSEVSKQVKRYYINKNYYWGSI